ncbi:MAG: hypothetical protein ORN85_08660 [Sediminibacterium sp.]|nr:hypothetical protein [Sediminibacterium sp.]
MKNLTLKEVIEIYLGDSLYQGRELGESKNLAYDEIRLRTIDYRKKSNL